jgi:hypothetical protein
VVATLTVLSLGAYVPIWFGLTWTELRKENKDPSYMPLGHALGTLIPGLNVVIVWRHFRAIDDLLKKASASARVDPMSAAIGIVIWWLTFTHYSTEPLFVILDAVELLAGTAVVVYGQRALNAYRASRGGEERVLETDLLALAVVVTYALFTLAGVLVGPS